LHTAQILLTQDDFEDRNRTLNMRNTLFTLVDEGIIPIINENDSVSVEEIKIGDNDTLAAQSGFSGARIFWSCLRISTGFTRTIPRKIPTRNLWRRSGTLGS
jgi:hypothetical protein